MTGPLLEVWARLAPVQKAMVTLIGVMAMIGLALGVSVSSRPQYTVLFSNLNAADAGAIVEKLKETKADYRITAGGTALEVPTKDVYDLRLQLAGEGLPQGGNVGFEIFDKSNFGMTEFTQKLDYQRALQGELARTISEMDPVAQARVHIVIPEPSVFSSQEKESTASVIVKLKPGGQLDAGQVSSVTHLVSSAVEGLKPGGVTVVDTNGNLLSEPDGGPGGATSLRQSASQYDMQKQYETRVSQDLQAMLDRVLGTGKAIVRVSARMNFDTKQAENDLVEPGKDGKGVLLSQDQMDEKYTGAPKNISGGAAALSTLGAATTAVARTPGSGDNYNRTQNNERYAVSKRVERIVEAPGKIERLSVAVLLDGGVGNSALSSIRQAVSTAAGLDTSRGDQVTVESIAFDNSAAKTEEKAMQQEARNAMFLTYGKWCVAVLIALIFMLFLRSTLRGPKRIEITESYGEPLSLKDAEAMEMSASHPSREPEMLDLRSQEDASPLRLAARRATEVAEEKPEEVAKLLRSWLSE